MHCDQRLLGGGGGGGALGFQMYLGIGILPEEPIQVAGLHSKAVWYVTVRVAFI